MAQQDKTKQTSSRPASIDLDFPFGPERMLKAARMWVDACGEQLDAAVGLCEEIRKDKQYPPARIVPDVLDFYAAWFSDMREIYEVLCHGDEGGEGSSGEPPK